MSTANAVPETAVTPSTPSRLRWGIILIVLLAAVVNYLDRANLSIANTTIAREFGFSSTQMGLLLSAFLWPYALANLPAGWLVDRFGPRKMFTGAMALWSAVTFLTGFVNTYSYFYGLRMMLGVAESPFFTSGIKITRSWFSDEERGLPTSVINTGSQIANALAPPLLTVLMLWVGWRGMFIAVGLLGLPLILAWLKFYRDPDAREVMLIHTGRSEEKDPAGTRPGWGTLFRNKITWCMIAGNFCVMFTIWVYLTWLPGYLETALGFSLKQTGFIASIPFLAGILGVLCGGMLSDKLVRRGVNTVTARKIPIVLGATLAACFVMPVPFMEHRGGAILLLAAGYFFSQMPSGVIWALAADIAPKDQVASLGAIQNFGGFLGAATAPVITGVILDTTGQFTAVFILGGCLLLLGACFYGFFVRQPRLP